MGFVQESEQSKRLRTQSSYWQTLVLEHESVEVIVQNLKCGIKGTLEHLHTLDVDWALCDHASESVD